MTGGRKRRLRVMLLVAAGLAAAAVAGVSHAGGLLEQPELETLDARFELRGEREPREDVVVVDISEETFGVLREQWPFPRSMHGRVIDRLDGYGAKVIAYDVVFTEPTEVEEDNALIRALRRAGTGVLSAIAVDDAGRSAVLGGTEALRFARARDGDTTLKPDAGGVYRRFPYEPQGLRSFSVVAAERATGERVDAGQFADDAALIDYAGGPRTIRHVPFERVLRGRADPAVFRDAIVIVGASAPSLNDVKPTSTSGDQLMSGAEIQASAIATVLDDFPLSESPWIVDALLIFGLAMVAPLLGLRVPPLVTFGAAVVAGVAYLGGVYLLFGDGLILPVLDPLAALLFGAVGALAVHYTLASLEREQVRVLFCRFVPENVVDQVVREADGLRLGGVDADSTVLFSDIRGFTGYSEGKAPELVLTVLNRYHTEMEAAIHDNGGTLISYMGDGIMAAFGVPVAQDDHAERGLRAAREMVGERLDRFNAWMREQGHGEGFRMGVGLNSGPVTAGTIGSERRLEYTAIGDTVNTASRLEGMTKGTQHQVFVAETTRERLARDPGDLVLIDDVEVRGRREKVRVWGVGAPAAPQTEQAAQPART